MTKEGNDNKILLSVVVPVYNVEKYIVKCLNTLRSINNDNYEIILINDGSTDSSYEIIKKIEKEDKRVTVYNNSNHGLSYTRNYGMEKARGEYVIFVDSDDYLKSTSFEQLIEKISRNDAVFFGYTRILEGEIIDDEQEKIVTKIINQEQLIEKLETDSFINDFGFAWNKIYKKSIIDKNNILFENNTCAREDLIFNLQYFQHVDNIMITENSMYYYVQYDNSLSRIGHEISEIDVFVGRLKSIVNNKPIYKDSMINRIVFSVIQNHIENKIFKLNSSMKEKNKEFLKTIKYRNYVENIADSRMMYRIYKYCFKHRKITLAYIYYNLSLIKKRIRYGQ